MIITIKTKNKYSLSSAINDCNNVSTFLEKKSNHRL